MDGTVNSWLYLLCAKQNFQKNLTLQKKEHWEQNGFCSKLVALQTISGLYSWRKTVFNICLA